MIIVENLRPGTLLLSASKLTLPKASRISLPESNSEIERAVKAGWVRIVPPQIVLPVKPNPSLPLSDSSSDASRQIVHDWLIDYAEAGNGKITITDRSTGKTASTEIAERKGEQHFTLKNFGTVKLQQFWPTSQALELFDAAQ